MSWGWPEGKPRKKGGPFRYKVDFRVNDWMYDKIERELPDDSTRSQWIRELLQLPLEELDLPRHLYPIHWVKITKRAVGDTIIDRLQTRGRFRLAYILQRLRERPLRRLLLG